MARKVTLGNHWKKTRDDEYKVALWLRLGPGSISVAPIPIKTGEGPAAASFYPILIIGEAAASLLKKKLTALGYPVTTKANSGPIIH